MYKQTPRFITTIMEKYFDGKSFPTVSFLSSSQKRALATISYGVEQGKGFILIIGEDGLGKTALLRASILEIDNSGKKVLCLFNGNFSFAGLLEKISRKLKLEFQGEESSLLLKIYDALKNGDENNKLVLLIDDAQEMPIYTLERLRLFANLETQNEKLIQVVLAGDPGLERKLNLEELRQLKHRIALKTRLSPLTQEESQEFIKIHLKKNGRKASTVFTRKAMNKIVRHCRGNLRTLDIICDNVLLQSHLSPQSDPAKSVKDVIYRMHGGRKILSRRLATASLAPLLLGLGVWGVNSYSRLPIQNNGVPHSIQGSKKTAQVIVVDKSKEGGFRSAGASPSKATPKNKIAPGERDDNKEELAVVKRVRSGDNLYRLIQTVYGFSNQDLLDLVKKNNPKVKEDLGITVGDKIIFPTLREKKEG
jgi:general secretion pathway protein A